MSGQQSTYLWVLGFRTWHHFQLLEVLRFHHGHNREKSPPAAWYAHRGRKTHWLDADAIGEVHISAGLSWRWYVESTTRLPKPPFLITDDPGLFPAYDGTMGFRPTKFGRRWLHGRLGPGHFLTALRGPDWLGVIAVTKAGAMSGRGHLIAFSATGGLPEAVYEGVMLAPFDDEVFGTIELTNRGPE